MKLTRKLIFSLALPALMLLSTGSEAAERLRLSSSVENAGKPRYRNSDAIKRTTVPRFNPAPPIERLRAGTNVYRYEGVSTTRHDECSSPAIIFHLRQGRVVPGHAFDYVN
ncbi:MAG TPA: hypothetical protein PK529_01010 [Verrucomicrobiales bacterium]|jgi:hypothetical protein|nr:hypothetical protein [Verrucomicrobiales bacterium]